MSLFEHEKRRSFYNPPDAEIVLFEDFFEKTQSDFLLEKIIDETLWQQDTISLYGRLHLVPRLTALYGDTDKSYTYSGIKMQPSLWTDSLLSIKELIENESKESFTTVLLNYYRSGKDSMGWHRDNEKELGVNPVIASVSFGETRPFHLRHKFRKDMPKIILPLSHGSLLLMKGSTQHFWEHQVPKSVKPLSPRINLTFRKILLA